MPEEEFMNEAGVSLLEIIIAITIFGVIITAIFGFYFQGWQVFAFNSERTEYQRNQRLIYTWVGQTVRKATYIDDNPAGDDEVRFRFPAEGNLDGLAFGLDTGGYFYVRKRESDSWGTPKRISDLRCENLDFTYSDNILVLDLTLLGENVSDYSFVDKFYPRCPRIVTP